MPSHTFQNVTSKTAATTSLFLIISLVPYRQIHPCLFVHDTPIMAKGLESGAAVIPTHAALTYAAEGHGAGGEMNNGVVDAAAAKMAVIQDPSLGFLSSLKKYNASG